MNRKTIIVGLLGPMMECRFTERQMAQACGVSRAYINELLHDLGYLGPRPATFAEAMDRLSRLDPAAHTAATLLANGK